MQWFFSLFIRPEIYAFIQNYKDDPSRWKFYPYSYRFVNKKDNLMIEFHQHFSSVYRFTGQCIMCKDDLRLFEKQFLCLTFKRHLTASTKPIPTKATHPEEFI